MRIPEEKEKGTERILKAIMAEIFPNQKREMDIQINEAQRTPTRLNPNRTTLQHIAINIVKSQR